MVKNNNRNKPSYIDFDHKAYSKLLKIYNLRGEIGVLSYSFSKLLVKHWRFATPALALISAKWLLAHFKSELISKRKISRNERFIRCDLCRKFLLMGVTRSMRYYNHKSGRKWAYKIVNNKKIWHILPSNKYTKDPIKLKSAKIFKEYHVRAWKNKQYQVLRAYFKKTRA